MCYIKNINEIISLNKINSKLLFLKSILFFNIRPFEKTKTSVELLILAQIKTYLIIYFHIELTLYLYK